MLELPELETARRDLDREVGGLKIKEIDLRMKLKRQLILEVLILREKVWLY